MSDRNDWRQTVTSQHQILATITGFTITGLIIFTSLGKEALPVQKVVVTTVLFLLAAQIALLLLMAEIERRTAFAQNIPMQEAENILRPIFNIISFLSWLSVTILLMVTVWS